MLILPKHRYQGNQDRTGASVPQLKQFLAKTKKNSNLTAYIWVVSGIPTRVSLESSPGVFSEIPLGDPSEIPGICSRIPPEIPSGIPLGITSGCCSKKLQ